MALTQGLKTANNIPDGHPGHTNGLFGSKVRLADKGRVMMVLEHESGVVSETVGLTHFYIRDTLTTAWTLRQSSKPPDQYAPEYTRSQGEIAISESAEYAAVQHTVIVGGNGTSQVQIYKRTAENVWVKNQILVHPLASGTVLADGTYANQRSIGGAISFSHDASVLVVAADSVNITDGSAIYIYTKNLAGQYVFRHEITETTLGIFSAAWRCRVSGDGNYIVVHAARDGGLPDKGQIFVFKRTSPTSTTWSLDAGPLTTDYETVNNYDLRDLQINYDGTTFVAVYMYFSGAVAPVFQCMKRTGSSWAVTHTKTGLTPWTTQEFPREIAMNFNGTRAVIGCHAGLGTDTGRFWLLVENSDQTWTITEQYEDPAGLSGDQFGDSVAMSYNGLNFVVGASNNTNQFLARHGSVYSFYADGYGASIDYSQSFAGSDVAVEGYRGVKLERSNVTGVINEFFTDLVDRLELYVDATGDSLLQVEIDMNNQQINNLGNAVYNDDLIPKSQAEALA